MRRTVSLPRGLFGMLVLIAVCELGIGHRDAILIHGDAWWWSLGNREVERVPRRDVLILGDSLVKLGVVPAILEQRSGRSAYNLALGGGQAPASYFLLRRVLEAGARPSAVLVDFFPSLMKLPVHHNIESWPMLLTVRDTVELAWQASDPSLLATLLLKKAVPSIGQRPLLRLAILRELWGLPRGGPDAQALRHRQRQHAGYQLMLPEPNREVDMARWQSDYFGRLEFNPVNAHFVLQFLRLAARQGITVYWLVPPMHEALEDQMRISGFDAQYTKFLRRQAEAGPNLVVIDGRGAGYDRNVFFDPHHLGREGAAAYSLALGDILAKETAGRPLDRWIQLPRYQPAAAGLSFDDPHARGKTIARGGSRTARRG